MGLADAVRRWLQIIHEFAKCDHDKINNPAGYLMGMLRRYHEERDPHRNGAGRGAGRGGGRGGRGGAAAANGRAAVALHTPREFSDRRSRDREFVERDREVIDRDFRDRDRERVRRCVRGLTPADASFCHTCGHPRQLHIPRRRSLRADVCVCVRAGILFRLRGCLIWVAALQISPFAGRLVRRTRPGLSYQRCGRVREHVPR